MLKATCIHCSFEASAETFEELDKIYESHSKNSGHGTDYHFYELERKTKIS
jgi:predicted small metal-binding protein